MLHGNAVIAPFLYFPCCGPIVVATHIVIISAVSSCGLVAKASDVIFGLYCSQMSRGWLQWSGLHHKERNLSERSDDAATPNGATVVISLLSEQFNRTMFVASQSCAPDTAAFSVKPAMRQGAASQFVVPPLRPDTPSSSPWLTQRCRSTIGPCCIQLNQCVPNGLPWFWPLPSTSSFQVSRFGKGVVVQFVGACVPACACSSAVDRKKGCSVSIFSLKLASSTAVGGTAIGRHCLSRTKRHRAPAGQWANSDTLVTA